MVYISGANKNRLGKRRFDALFDAGCGQLQKHASKALPLGGPFSISGRDFRQSGYGDARPDFLQR
ncbi:hypothetical protein ACOJBO_41615 [Rhizobium beringeri]